MEVHPQLARELARLSALNGDSRKPHEAIILVAEDDTMVRNVVSRALTRENYFILMANDGEEALLLSDKTNGRIDLLVTDVEMPRLDGLRLCERLLRDRMDMRVLIMSGMPLGGFTKSPGVAFLPKPFSLADLKTNVNNLLAQSDPAPASY